MKNDHRIGEESGFGEGDFISKRLFDGLHQFDSLDSPQ